MQRAQLAILYELDSLNTYNGHLGREGEERERERKHWRGKGFAIKMSRFVFLTIAIIRARFVFISTVIIKPFTSIYT